jgi:hypothetical protein
VTPPPTFDPEVAAALREATQRIDELHMELLAAFPVFQGTLALPGILIGHGLGALVVNGMTNDQIIAKVLAIVAGIREQLLVS